jgi:hypothetical protein
MDELFVLALLTCGETGSFISMSMILFYNLLTRHGFFLKWARFLILK